MSQRLVLVLGMHRSGTSAIARALEVYGYSLGKHLMPAGRDNPKGFFEDLDIVALNDKILNFFNLSWKSTRVITNEEFDTLPFEFVERADELLHAKLATDETWFAIKDPRLCITLPFWQRVLNTEAQLWPRPILVIVIRHPYSVAASLFRRDGMKLEESLELWRHYYTCLLDRALLPGWPKIVIDYDQMIAQPENQMSRLGAFLGHGPMHPGEVITYAYRFLEENLRHTHFVENPIDHPAVGLLWSTLRDFKGFG